MRPDGVDRPSICAAAVSPTAVSNVAASALLLVCFFLPHSTGSGSAERPVSIIALLADGSVDAIDGLCVLWPFGLATYTLAALAGIVLVRPSNISHVLVLVPVIFSAALTGLWMLYLFSGTEASRDAMVLVAVIAPLGSCVAARMVWLARLGELAAAAAWGQSLLCVLAAFSLRWFWIHQVKSLDWGGMLAIGAAIMMMIASWTWYTHGYRDLSDRTIRTLPLQVSLRRILAAVAAAAVALTYWQALDQWGN